MRNITLLEMQQIELEILLELDNICKKYGLRYYMDGGTLLGAMCYEGFIPWDDDIDLKMPRPDYEKFIQLGSEFPEYMELDAPRKDHCEYTMLKIVDSRTVLKEGNKTTGVYIDVFPMDGHPDDEEECREHIRNMQRLNSLFHASLNGFENMKSSKSLKSKIKGNIYSVTYSPWKLYRRLTEAGKKYEYDKCSKVGLLVEGDPMKERFKKEWLEDGFELEFEGHMLPAPSGYREHMVIFYGDHVIKPECYHNLPQYPSNHEHEVYWKE